MPCTSDYCSSSQPGPHTTARYRKVLSGPGFVANGRTR